jgi:HD-GYP domain-containing protein (c-di-GMP phosphodiesterase class II)
LQGVVDVPYCHHEKWDGSGYPRRLAGEQIPLLARVFVVADVWDALTSERSYRKAWPVEDARQFIYTQAGIHFDPDVARAFLRLQADRQSAITTTAALYRGEIDEPN